MFQTSIMVKALNKKNNMRAYKSRMIKKGQVVKYEAFLKADITQAANGMALMVGDLTLEVEFTFGDRRARDIQNCLDILCDVMEGIVYTNDSQITKIIATKVYSKGVWNISVKVT